jgi:hypothetical protein
MQSARRASLAVVLFLASVGTASAAWVLWAESRRVREPLQGRTEWSIEQSVEQRTECVTEMDRVQESFKKAGLVRVNDTHLIMPAREDSYWHIEWRCLPDTIDPRGPTGSR